jgi:hypothetical protein
MKSKMGVNFWIRMLGCKGSSIYELEWDIRLLEADGGDNGEAE